MTLLSILADFNSDIVWMISTRPLISKSSSNCINPLVTVPRTPITIGIIIIFMFHSFFNSLARSKYLSFCSVSFSFIIWSVATTKSTILQVLFFLLIITRSDHLAEIKWSVCISKSQGNSCISFSRTDSGLCLWHLFAWSNFNFLHNSIWITLATQLCLVLYSFRNNLLHSLIMWLIVSSLLSHNLQLLFCYVLSILALIWLVLMRCFLLRFIIIIIIIARKLLILVVYTWNYVNMYNLYIINIYLKL